MSTLSKLALVVILVLTLSIMLQPQPGICASMVEYGPTCGEIAIPGQGFRPAQIVLEINSVNETENLFIGKLGILLNNNWRIFDCTGSANQTTGEFYITTNTVDKYNALVYFDGATMYLQVPGTGISGIFAGVCP